MKLLKEVEEIRTREEMLEKEIQLKLEEEILRMQQEQEREIKSQITLKLKELLRILESNSDKEHQSLEENENKLEDTLKLLETKARRLIEKVDVLQENKELLMKERMIFEERITEFSYENQLATK